MTTKEKIIDAAVNEFSEGGYPGARVDRIALKAGVNKAMIFYYFGSKEDLYKQIIRKIVGELFDVIRNSGGLDKGLEPGVFFDTITETYIRFFSGNRHYMKIIGTDLIQNPVNLKGALENFFDSDAREIPMNLREMFGVWYRSGKITEPQPMHLFLNILSLCIFPLIARVFPEVVFEINLDDDAFVEERIKSVKNLLKRGVLT